MNNPQKRISGDTVNTSAEHYHRSKAHAQENKYLDVKCLVETVAELLGQTPGLLYEQLSFVTLYFSESVP
jgi:hypothetical protein